MRSKKAEFGIIGIGNVLLGDDALGPYAISLLQSRWEWPEDVELIDAGTPGPELALLMQPFKCVIVIDAVDTGASPGALSRLNRGQVISAPVSPGRTPHDPGLTAALLQLELMESGPDEIILLGMTVDRTRLEIGLSHSVRSALPKLLDMVIRELESHGIFPKKREKPLPENIWWEKKS